MHTGPSGVANRGITFVFDIRHPNWYIATKIWALSVAPLSVSPTLGQMSVNSRHSPRACCERWGKYMPLREVAPERVANVGVNECRFEALKYVKIVSMTLIPAVEEVGTSHSMVIRQIDICIM
jgi:hypothetical protein